MLGWRSRSRLRISRRSSVASPTISTGVAVDGRPDAGGLLGGEAEKVDAAIAAPSLLAPHGRAGSPAGSPRRARRSRRGCARSRPRRGCPAASAQISTAMRRRASGERSSWLALASSAFCAAEQRLDARGRDVEAARHLGDLVAAALADPGRSAPAPQALDAAAQLLQPARQPARHRIGGERRPPPATSSDQARGCAGAAAGGGGLSRASTIAPVGKVEARMMHRRPPRHASAVASGGNRWARHAAAISSVGCRRREIPHRRRGRALEPCGRGVHGDPSRSGSEHSAELHAEGAAIGPDLCRR